MRPGRRGRSLRGAAPRARLVRAAWSPRRAPARRAGRVERERSAASRAPRQVWQPSYNRRMSTHAISRVPDPYNEPVRSYAPGTPEREELRLRLQQLESQQLDIPLVIGGEEVRTGNTFEAVEPHKRSHVLGTVHKAGAKEVERAIAASQKAAADWSRTPWEERATIILRAAELPAGPGRQTLNAATMLGQSKTAHQAEIDSACDLIDFWRFNVKYAEELYRQQPRSGPGMWNATELRPLEGFVFALTPFNFTAISGNLPAAPALMGNTVGWKPAETQLLAAWQVYQLLEEAGMPPGVINFIPGLPHGSTNTVLDHPMLAGIHFTGSTDVFRMMWKRVAENIDRYKGYPRLVGETGGKDFILAHASADPQALATAIVRGGFEYQGEKCSAASRIYVPESLWPEVKGLTLGMMETVRMGDPADFRNFMGAVIDRKA